jgi:LysM repeat protein
MALVVALLLGLLVGFAAGRALAGPARLERPRTYVVRPGDTLWGIAVRLAGPHADPRPAVDRLMADNHLTSPAIAAGQRLSLPAA